MATYFHGSSEIQATSSTTAPSDGIQTLYLMNPNNYHHPQQPPNMLFFNPAALAPPTNHQQHLVGIPLSDVASPNPDNHSHLSSSSLHGVVPVGLHYNSNIWGVSGDQNSVASDSAVAQDVVPPSQFRRPVDVSSARQGLSLSLSPQQALYRPISNQNEDIQAIMNRPVSGEDTRVSGNSPSSVSAVSNGVSDMQNMVSGSKYLRAAQELLDEVVNVGKGINSDLKAEGRDKERTKMNKEHETGDGSGDGGGNGCVSGSKGGGSELTTVQRQELQMKKAKLVNMLDEVEQRYRQYHHQMQLVVSSFEHAAGTGAARSYTALALQTMSRRFRCLKDAISGQIKAACKGLGEEDCLGAKVEGSRLRFVDHQIRQQRALQQLGMIQHNAWRPQRGLPERAVSVLRAWLFEHFLHPYPKDSDKHMLAKQTGLTRSQVSNWFINARVRLWKPMVEEMYLEEIKEQEKNGSQENTIKNLNKDSASNSGAPADINTLQMDQLKSLQSKPPQKPATSTEFSNSTVSISPMGGGSIHLAQPGFTLITSPELEGMAQRSPKKPRGGFDMQNSPSSILSMDMEMKQSEARREISLGFGRERLTKDGYPLITSAPAHVGGFGAFPMGDLGRFNPEQFAAATPRFNGNSVSLTLGLPHCESQQNFLSNQGIQLGRRLEMGVSEPDFCAVNASQNSHSGSGFENIDIQSRKRLAAQLLPDFVA